MKRVIVWGTGKRTAMYRKWLESMYQILAYVNTNQISGSIYGIRVIKPDEVNQIDFDLIILCTENVELEETRETLAQIDNSYLEKSITVDELNSMKVDCGYLDYVGRLQLKVIKELLTSSDNKIEDYNWMLSKVIEYGLFCFDDEHWNEVNEVFNWAVYGLQQVPEEFAEFCCRISSIETESAAEIGVYRGRSAFFICAILARNNLKLKYKMIDIVNRIDDFDLFKEALPQLELCIPSTSEDYKGESFDFVFIDADHSYDASMRDYEKVGMYAKKLVAFHDIYAHEYDAENGGAVRTWKEVLERTKDKEHWIFSKYPDKWMGIGCVLMR